MDRTAWEHYGLQQSEAANLWPQAAEKRYPGHILLLQLSLLPVLNPQRAIEQGSSMMRTIEAQLL